MVSNVYARIKLGFRAGIHELLPWYTTAEMPPVNSKDRIAVDNIEPAGPRGPSQLRPTVRPRRCFRASARTSAGSAKAHVL